MMIERKGEQKEKDDLFDELHNSVEKGASHGDHFPITIEKTFKGKWSPPVADFPTPTRIDVIGYLPTARRDAEGNVLRDAGGNVMCTLWFQRLHVRGASWIDNLMLQVAHLMPTFEHVRVLLALHAMTNSLDFGDIKPLATFNTKTEMYEPNDETLGDDLCGYSVPTLCVRIPNLSFANATRFLHPSVSMSKKRMQDDAAKSGMLFDDKALDALHAQQITEEQFGSIIEDFVQWGLMRVGTDEDGNIHAVLNHLSMAQCPPNMRLEMLQGAPVDGLVTPLSVKQEDGFDKSGNGARDSKATKGSRQYWRIKSGEQTKKLKFATAAVRMIEEKYADDRAEWQEEKTILTEQATADATKINAFQVLFAEMQERVQEIINSDKPDNLKVGALSAVFTGEHEIDRSKVNKEIGR